MLLLYFCLPMWNFYVYNKLFLISEVNVNIVLILHSVFLKDISEQEGKAVSVTENP